MNESLLGIEGGRLNTFAIDRPPLPTSRVVPFIHELASSHRTVAHSRQSVRTEGSQAVNPAERSARWIRQGIGDRLLSAKSGRPSGACPTATG
jgi:hypothetical protein